tara:strand:+ start:1714 stop:2481 length:768 start_codon:yes stop_codon:yes gene_type:complete
MALLKSITMIKKNDNYLIIIPARYNSTRLPGKPLLKIFGKTMLNRVWESCIKVSGKDKVLVATDSDKIARHCKEVGMNFLMTSSKCKTGTDRVIEVSKKIKRAFYINVQGDEPLVSTSDIKKVISTYNINRSYIINGMSKIHSEKDFKNINIPKIATDNDSNLLFISRSPIPITKKKLFKNAYKQVCIYAFPRNVLNKKNLFNKKSKLESIEDIEILRFLENGFKVKMVKLSNKSVAVDTLQDLNKVRKIFNAKK